MSTFSIPINYAVDDPKYGDGDERDFNVSITGTFSGLLNIDALGNVSGTSSASITAKGSTPNDEDGDDDSFSNSGSGSGAPVVGSLTSGIRTTVNLSDGDAVGFIGQFNSTRTAITGTLTLSDFNLGASVAIPITIPVTTLSYTADNVVLWAYGQALNAPTKNTPSAGLPFVQNALSAVISQRNLDAVHSVDPVLCNAEYYLIGVAQALGDRSFVASWGYPPQYSYSFMAPFYEVFKAAALGIGALASQIPGLGYTQSGVYQTIVVSLTNPGSPFPPSPPSASAVFAIWKGVDEGKNGNWVNSANNAVKNSPVPTPGQAFGSALNADPNSLLLTLAAGAINGGSDAAAIAYTDVFYERSIWSGTQSVTDGNVTYQVIGGPGVVPQTGNSTIIDELNSPLTLVSGNHSVFETVAGQTVHLGSGSDQVFTSGGVNVIYPGMGADMIVGDGNDALDYAAITGSVTVDLSAGAARKSNGVTDFFGGIQIVIGSPGNDAITCEGLGDVVAGGGDVITPAVSTAYTPAGAIGTNWTIIGTKDVSGDGKADYLWANAGKIDLWTISNGVLTFAGLVGGAIGSDWTAKTIGDFNHDGFADVLWVNAGRVAVWELQGTAIIAGGVSNGQIGTNFSFKGLGDFNHDGNSDVVWQSNTGQVAIWLMQGSDIVTGGLTNAAIGTDWTMGGTGDFNGDGHDDALWFNSSGQAVTWLMNGVNGAGVTSAAISGTIGAGWKVGGIADMNMDGKADVVWWNPANNAVAIWYMNGTRVAGSTMISNGGQIGTDWKLSGVGDVTGDGIPDIVWTRPNGSSVIWNLRGNGDQLIGGAGRDTFQINTLSEMGEVISNFQPGAGQDVLDLHNLLTSIGHDATNAFADGTVRLVQDGTAVEVEVDTSPGEHHYVRAATLQNVAASTLVPGNFQVSASPGSSGEAGSDEQAGDLAPAAGASTSDPGAQFAAADSTSQIVHAMAGFGGAGGAADGMTSAFGAEASQQQQFLTAPQHA
jgi:hypothetical protein